MRKRIISSLLILTLLITGIMLGKAPVAYASGNSETGRSSEQHDSINAAKLIVATFVAEDIKNNAESGWNQNSDVSGDATIVYDMNDGILGYMFSIYNAGIGNGYVVISTEDYGFSIIEYISYINVLLQKKSGKRVTEHMWSHMLVNTGKLSIVIYHETDRLI